MVKYNRARTTEQVILIFKDVHGDIYDYSKTVYTNSKEKLTIGCRIHGDFKQLFYPHAKGHGCIQCGIDKCSITSRKSTEYIVNKFKDVHGNRYVYKNTVYVKSSDKVLVECREHGEFRISPHDHIGGKGCSICGNKKKRFGVGASKNTLIAKSLSKTNGKLNFYIIKCWGGAEIFYKFGVTTGKIKKRFAGKNMPYNYQLLTLITGDSSSVYDFELLFSRLAYQDNYRPLVYFGGHGECFSKFSEIMLKNICEFKDNLNVLEKPTN